jgi:hypothetical protein
MTATSPIPPLTDAELDALEYDVDHDSDCTYLRRCGNANKGYCSVPDLDECDCTAYRVRRLVAEVRAAREAAARHEAEAGSASMEPR